MKKKEPKGETPLKSSPCIMACETRHLDLTRWGYGNKEKPRHGYTHRKSLVRWVVSDGVGPTDAQ